jgi:hypothetical protein
MWRWLRWWRPPYLLRSVIVNLRDDPTTAISGVLWTSRGPWLIVRQASLLKAQQASTALDGEVVIERDNVAFVQMLS